MARKLITDLSNASASTIWRRENPEKWSNYLLSVKLACTANQAAYRRRKEIAESSDYDFVFYEFSRMKARAKKHKFACSVTPQYLLKLLRASNMKCTLSNSELVLTVGNPNKASFDRINNNRGYVKGNIQVVSATVNYARHVLTVEQFIALSKQVAAYNTDIDQPAV